MDKQARAALQLTRELHTSLTALKEHTGEEERAQLRKLAAKTHNAVGTLRKLAAAEVRRAGLESVLLREAVAGEGVDRQANAARVQERLRVTMERATHSDGGSRLNETTPIERAQQAVAAVDAGIDALCPHARPPPLGPAQLARMREIS
jgi:hypothetical protein